MDLKPNGLLGLLVLVSLLLGVQLRPVLRDPPPFSCKKDVESTKSLSELLEKEAKEFLALYAEYGPFNDSTPEDVPDSTVSGENFAEKLLDIHAKDKLFALHLKKAIGYQKDILGDPERVEEIITRVEDRISNLLIKVDRIVEGLYPDTPLPPHPGPLNISHDDDYKKKKYSWDVVHTVKSWAAQVAQELEKGKTECETRQHFLLSSKR